MGPISLSKKQFFILALACFAVYLPFLDKGITNDDIIFLDYANRLTRNPFRCEVADQVFQGKLIKDLVVFESTHPPLIPYYLKFLKKLFGIHIGAFHLFYFPFLLLAALSLAEMIARFTSQSPLLALPFVLGPLFLPNATTLMTDVPLFAFWLAALCCWLRVLEDKQNHWLWLTIAFCWASFFTAYQGLGLLPLILIHGALKSRFKSAVLISVIAFMPFAIWVIAVYLHYGFFPYFAPPRAELSITTEVTKGLVLENIILKSKTLVLYFGASIGLFSLLLKVSKTWLAGILAITGWSLYLVTDLFRENTLIQSLFPFALFGLGLGLLPVIYRTFRQTIVAPVRQSDQLLLLVWTGGFLLFQAAIAAFAAPRYNFLLLAPVFLMLLQQIQQKFLFAVSLLILLLGFAVGWADKSYAEAQKIENLPLAQDASIHFLGEGGMKFSGERAGYGYFRPGLESELRYLLIPEEIDHIPVPDGLFKNGEKVDSMKVESWLPIKVMNRKAGAGMYYHARGLLPFAFSTDPIDTFTLYKYYRTALPDWTKSAAPRYVPAGQILPSAAVYQDFTCDADGLCILKLHLATYARTNHSTLIVSISELKGSETLEVFRQAVDASTLLDNHERTFKFPRLSSKGKKYRVQLESPDATPQTAVTIWSNADKEHGFYYGQEQKQGSLGIEALCF